MGYLEKASNAYKDKDVNEKQLIDIAETYVNDNGLYYYVRDISISDRKGSVLGYYDLENRVITVYKRAIEKYVDLVERYTCLYGEEYRIERLTDLMIFKVLFHELDHASQIKKANEEDTFEGDIFRFCQNIAANKKALYEIVYPILLCEYHADMESLIAIDKIDHFWSSTSIGNVYNYYRVKNLGIAEYDRFNMIYNGTKEIPDMSVHDKITYGMPLEKEEKGRVLSMLKAGNYQ